MTGDKIKIVERAGTMVKRILHKSNPWAGGNCGRGACLICRQEKGGDCKKRNITYKTQCLQCQESGKMRQYFGESARTGFERGQEHQNDYSKNQEDSHMLKHWQEDHSGEEKPAFSMQVLRGHKSAFVRQIHEAVLIEMNVETILNSKGEYNRCQLPRLGVKMGERDAQEKSMQAEMNEAEIFSCIKDSSKRRDDWVESSQPSKRMKYKIGRPRNTVTSKRQQEENGGERPSKRTKTCRSYEVEDIHPVQKTTQPPAQQDDLSTCDVIRSEATICENVHDENLPNLPKEIFTVRKNAKSTPSPKMQPESFLNQNFDNSISIFEDSTVYKQGGEAKNIKPDASPAVKMKAENKAYPPPTTATESTKSVSNNVVKLKSKLKVSKLHLPAQFRVRKITEHFPAARPNVDTATILV